MASHRTTITHRLVILGLSALFLFGCKRSQQGTQGTVSQAQASPKAPTLRLKIKGADGKKAIKMKLKRREFIVHYWEGGTKHTLRGVVKRKGKRKYSKGNNVVASIKYKDGRWKLRGPNGKNRWKIKLYTDKVKIIASQPGTQRFTIVKKNATKLKVRAGKTSLGRVKYKPATGKLKGKDAAKKLVFKAKGSRLSMAYGVMLIQALSIQDRAILVAELLADQR